MLDELVDEMFRRLTVGGAAVEVTSGFPSKTGLHERRRGNVKGATDDGVELEALASPRSPASPVSADRTSTVNQSMVNLLNAILGTGVLGLPYCYKTCGVLLSTVAILICLAVCTFSLQALLYSSTVTSKYSYEDVAHATLGLNGRRVVRVSTLALLMGCVVAYINIISDIFSSVAGTIVPPGAEPSRQQVMILVVVMGFFPLTLLIRSAKSIASTSGFGLAMVWFSVSPSFFLVLFVLHFLLLPSPSLRVPLCG
jgi:amino acid permease